MVKSHQMVKSLDLLDLDKKDRYLLKKSPDLDHKTSLLLTTPLIYNQDQGFDSFVHFSKPHKTPHLTKNTITTYITDRRLSISPLQSSHTPPLNPHDTLLT